MAFILAAIVGAIVAFVAIYIQLTVLSFNFFGMFFVGALMTIPFIVAFINKDMDTRDNSSVGPVVGGIVGVCFVVLLAISFVMSSPMIHADSYKNLIGKIVESKDHSLPPIDIKNAPLVSRHMAEQVAQKKISSIPTLGSQVELGFMIKESIKGKLYWVGFLEHSGFWQWKNRGYTPGYIKVSASDSNDVEFVTELKGQKLQMRYLNSAFFGDNAERRIYMDGTKSYGLTDFSPEVDDEGVPYLVASLYDHTIGFSGADTVKTALLNVQTGQVQIYNVADTPAWVDRIHPEHFIVDQVTDWGHYVHGWLNPSQSDRLMISDNIDLVYGEDGHCYFYLGITSVGKENGVAGFMLINSRTKESKIFYQPGASEEVAAGAAVDVIPEKHYHATNPLAFNVDGVPTYIMTLTDGNGIPRAYGMVNMANHLVLAVNDSLANTYQLYLSRLAHKNIAVNIDEKSDTVDSLETTVERVASELKGGNTMYYFVLKGQTHIFVGTSDLSDKLVLTRVGDKVSVRFEKTEGKTATLVGFDNAEIH